MSESELVKFICLRNSILCDFIDKLREADFSYQYRTKLVDSLDSYIKAARAVYNHLYN